MDYAGRGYQTAGNYATLAGGLTCNAPHLYKSPSAVCIIITDFPKRMWMALIHTHIYI